MSSSDSLEDYSDECIICYEPICDNDPYALPDNDCDNSKKCHPECLELWYTNYSNRGLITDRLIKTFKIYHLENPIETIKVQFEKEPSDSELDIPNEYMTPLSEFDEERELLQDNNNVVRDEINEINYTPIMNANNDTTDLRIRIFKIVCLTLGFIAILVLFLGIIVEFNFN